MMPSRRCVHERLHQWILWGAIRRSGKNRTQRCACYGQFFVVLSIIFRMQNRRFATLISLMLSSQTKDEVTDAAVAKLRTALGGSLCVDALIAADESAVSEAIAKVGFWRRKTQYVVRRMSCALVTEYTISRYLKQTAQRLRDDFDSDVPKTVDELCSLPGVGPKMAFLALQVAWNL